MRKLPEPGTEGRDYVATGGVVTHSSDEPRPLSPDAAKGAQPWLDVMGSSAAHDRGPQHAKYLNDPAFVAKANKAAFRSRVDDFVAKAGWRAPTEAIDTFVEALLAANIGDAQ